MVLPRPGGGETAQHRCSYSATTSRNCTGYDLQRSLSLHYQPLSRVPKLMFNNGPALVGEREKKEGEKEQEKKKSKGWAASSVQKAASLGRASGQVSLCAGRCLSGPLDQAALLVLLYVLFPFYSFLFLGDSASGFMDSLERGGMLGTLSEPTFHQSIGSENLVQCGRIKTKRRTELFFFVCCLAQARQRPGLCQQGNGIRTQAGCCLFFNLRLAFAMPKAERAGSGSFQGCLARYLQMFETGEGWLLTCRQFCSQQHRGLTIFRGVPRPRAVVVIE